MAKDEPARPPTTPYEKFRAAVKQVLSVPKEELEKRETEWRKKRVRRSRRRPA
jgi:hypothetical protein